MSYFPQAVAAELAGRTVRRARLVELDFASGTWRVWTGAGPIRAGGAVWQGLGQLAGMEGLDHAIAGGAPQASFTLSGVDPDLVGKVKSQSSEVRGRDVTVSLQLFDADWQPLDQPFAIYVGVMDVMRYSVRGASQAAITLTAESLFARAGFPIFGDLSDRDQQCLFPGDRGLEGMAQVPFSSPTWPIITVS